jgi:hypothetical protein
MMRPINISGFAKRPGAQCCFGRAAPFRLLVDSRRSSPIRLMAPGAELL